MSLGRCIPGMVQRGEIDPARAARMADLFGKLEKHYARGMGREAAAAMASEETLRQLNFEAALKKRQAGLQILRQKSAAADADLFKGKSRYEAIKALIDDHVEAPYGNSERGAQRIEQQAHAGMRAFIERHRRTLLGRPSDKAGLVDIVNELHGGDSGNPRAKLFAEAVADTFETLRLRFNAAGGAIGKLANFGMAHRHDSLKVRRAGFDRWRADILPELDVARMIDMRTGGAFTPETLDEALVAVWENIRTNGLAGEAAANGGGAAKLANSRSDHRFLQFKDGEAWLRYHDKYGTGNAFEAIMGHVRGMAQDIAMMERFGPNPNATMRWLLDRADRLEAQSAKASPGAVRGTSPRRGVEKLWKYVNGGFSVPVEVEGAVIGPLHRGLTVGLAGTRDLLTAAMLGSAPLSSISDFNTQIMARKLAGLPRANVLWQVLKQLNPASARDRRLAIRLGLGMRDASRAMLGVHRYFGETNGPMFTSVLADDVLRLSGLNKLTEAQQRAAGLNFLGELGEQRGQPFDKLDPDLRGEMERNGIDAAAWDVMRAAETVEEGGAHFMAWDNIADQKVSDRMMDMVLAHTARAVQEAVASTRALMTVDNPGTLGGEAMKASLQFKGFAFGLLRTHAQIIASLGPVSGAAYAAQFFIGMTLFGAATLQLRELVKGRDLRPMDDPEFWADAALQGGGIGIFGDLVGSFTNDRVGSIGEFVAGPLGSLAKDIKTSVIDNIRKDDAHEHKGAAAIRMAKRYVPGTNLWYARLAWERMVLDQLEEEIDPDYRQRRRRLERTARDQGQDIFWAPGETAPERAPAFANALGEEELP